MSLRFLIVDDTRFMRLMLTDILRKLDFEVAGEADNGERAIELYRECNPDIVFMDISMPGMDGVEALTHIRRADPDAIVIICSAVSQQDLIEQAMAQGASGYVMKPFKPKQIREVIEKVKPAKPEPSIGSDWLANMQALREQREETGELAEVAVGGRESGQWDTGSALAPEPAPAPAAMMMPELQASPASPAETASEEICLIDPVPSEEIVQQQENVQQEETPLGEAALQQEETLTVEEALPSETTMLPEAAVPDLALPPEQHPPAEPEQPGLPGQRFEHLVGCRWTDGVNGSETVYRAWLAPGSPTLEIACEGGQSGQIRLSVDDLVHLLDWVKAQSSPSTTGETERLS